MGGTTAIERFNAQELSTYNIIGSNFHLAPVVLSSDQPSQLQITCSIIGASQVCLAEVESCCCGLRIARNLAQTIE